MIDIHCHILPGIDDGAKDMVEALALVNIAVGRWRNTYCRYATFTFW